MLPERLAWRLILGLVTGAVLVVALHQLVTADSGEVEDTFPWAPAPGVGRQSPGVLASLQANGIWLIYLAVDARELPPTAAPVVAIRSDGRLLVLRPPPRAAEPGERWMAAGVVLPVAALADLTADQRVALLDVCAALAAGGRLEADQLIPAGRLDAPRSEREALVRWRR